MSISNYEKHEHTMHEFSKLRVQQLYDLNDPNYELYMPEIDPTADAYTTLVPYKPNISIHGPIISLYIPEYIDKITLCRESHIDKTDCTALDIYTSIPRVEEVALEIILNQTHSIPFNNTIGQIEIMLDQTRSIPCTEQFYADVFDSFLVGYKRVVFGEPFFHCVNKIWIFLENENYIFYAETIILPVKIKCNNTILTYFNNECMYASSLFGDYSIINSKSSRKITQTNCTNCNLTLYKCSTLCNLMTNIHNCIHKKDDLYLATHARKI